MNPVISCTNCHYALQDWQDAECPECGHPVAASRDAFARRGVALDEGRVRALRGGTALVLAALSVVVGVFALRIANDWIQSNAVYHLSGYALAACCAAIGIGTLWLLDPRRSAPWATFIGFITIAVVVVATIPGTPATPRSPALLVGLACAFIPVLLGVTMLQLGPSFRGMGLATTSRSSGRAMILLGLVGGAAVLAGLPTEQGALGLVVLANLASGVVIFRACAALLRKARTAIPAPR